MTPTDRELEAASSKGRAALQAKRGPDRFESPQRGTADELLKYDCS